MLLRSEKVSDLLVGAESVDSSNTGTVLLKLRFECNRKPSFQIDLLCFLLLVGGGLVGEYSAERGLLNRLHEEA